MGEWQQIWGNDGAKRLWRVPDRQVTGLVRDWSADGDIKRVLDLGCGIGRHALLLARAGYEVYASDHSQTGIDSCNQWLADEGLTAHTWCAEADDIPYPDGWFDAVIAFNSIYHGSADNLITTMQRLHAKLRSGGRCFVTLLSLDNRMYGKGEQVDRDTFISQGMFHQVFAHGGERGVPHHFSSEEEVHRLFQGFEIDRLSCEELMLPSSRYTDTEEAWFKIPGAWFWRIVAHKT